MSQQDAQRALSMIQRAKAKGRASDVSLTRPGTPGTYNPETGKVEGATEPKDHKSIGVKIGYDQRDIDGTAIQQGDQKLYVPAQGFIRPVSGEQITVGADVYNIVSVEVLAPGDTDILYTIQIRGV